VPLDFDINYNQLGIIGAHTVDVTGDNLYTRVSGELTGGNKTRNVYRALQHLLEDYDGIGSTQIDYGNLTTLRSDWHVGRQITEQKNGYDYLKELCAQSFVGLVPTRKGNRKLSAWIEDTTSTATHDESKIVKGSIKDFKLTPISNLYNSFDIKYGYNPGRDDYDKTFFIHKVDAAIDDLPEGYANWGQYVGGLPDGSYRTANLIWKSCHDSYKQAEAEQPAPASLSQLDWYIDGNLFDGAESYIDTNSSAWNYLWLFVDWTTHQKKSVTYSLPLTAANVTLELLDRVTFSDKIYTNDVGLGGWITKIKYNINKDLMDITLTLAPEDTYDTGLIIERGNMGDDTITERGDEGDDTITEGSA